VVNALRKAVDGHKITPQELPFIFVRVRDIYQFKTLLGRCRELDLLCGFVFPKFSSFNGYAYLEALEQANMKYGTSFYAMPILESEKIIYKETRMEEMLAIKELLDRHRDRILNVRIGATDFSSLFSIRRGMDFTIYDIQVISNCISDIVNVFGRAEQSYVISGPVWEYFPASSRLLKPQLRATPFERRGDVGREERKKILHQSIDGLIKEVILDKANGLTGKTIIHPSHICYVNALQSVTLEEYEDARQIVDNLDQGVLKSKAGNKMNEVKPHLRWAKKILIKAEIYGVINKDEDYTALFE
ncbi:MAG: HpcH/HpaI aldolase/citrate lyase family protein, partial [Clostridiaceae bacterium]|nr:HpcH/HpaI aldolase/citrate lyase family protein [Clostridiaceae bacterium]